jgi:hypothetical protein
MNIVEKNWYGILLFGSIKQKLLNINDFYLSKLTDFLKWFFHIWFS